MADTTFTIHIDASDFAQLANRFEGGLRELPWVMSRLLNESVRNARQVLVQQTWPRSINQRNTGFISATLHMEFATKRNLVAEINTESPAARPAMKEIVARHAYGGTRRPVRSRFLAVPASAWIIRTAFGVRQDQSPRYLIERTPKRALRITDKGIFVAENGRLQLRYSFHSSTEQPKDVPFVEDFKEVVLQTVRTGFQREMLKALAPRPTNTQANATTDGATNA